MATRCRDGVLQRAMPTNPAPHPQCTLVALHGLLYTHTHAYTKLFTIYLEHKIPAPLIILVSLVSQENEEWCTELGKGSKASIPGAGVNRGISILDFILRLIAIIGTFGGAIAMGTTNETLPFFTQFLQFRAEYDDPPTTFMFFVIENSIVSGYLVLTVPISIFHIVRSGARASRIVLLFLDTVMLALLTAAASAVSAIVYLAYKGNAQANWFAICQQFNSFCERISGSLIGSFGEIVVFILLVLLSAVAISRC